MGRLKGSKNTKKKKWMSKDGKSTMVFEDKWEEYISNGWHYGHDTDKQKELHKKFYTNGIITKAIKQGEAIPEGFYPGMADKRPGGYSKFEYKWYTNGKEQKRLSLIKGDKIPEGWWQGQADWMAEKSRNAAKGKVRTKEQRDHHRIGAEKAWKVKLERGTFNSSKQEEDYYKYLCDTYGEDDVVRQYKESRYPWHCDFYVKSKDLFIELNKFPTHYKEPFDENNEDHVKLLEHCKNNPNNWVERRMADVWANYDVKKRKWANDHGLNFIEIY